MGIVITLIGLALMVMVAAYVARPLVTGAGATWAPVQESPREKLLAERDLVYAAIHELDFDFQTGKLLEVDYRSMREMYAARGARVLQQLDALTAERQSEAEARSDEIEAAVRARRRSALGDQQSMVGHKCPVCGHPFDPTDRFCARCGAPLSGEVRR